MDDIIPTPQTDPDKPRGQAAFVAPVIAEVAVAPDLTVWEQYRDIITSTRFHQLAIAFAVQTAQHYGYIDNWLANAITVFVAASIAIRTVDRFSQKPAPAAPSAQ